MYISEESHWCFGGDCNESTIYTGQYGHFNNINSLHWWTLEDFLVLSIFFNFFDKCFVIFIKKTFISSLKSIPRIEPMWNEIAFMICFSVNSLLVYKMLLIFILICILPFLNSFINFYSLLVKFSCFSAHIISLNWNHLTSFLSFLSLLFHAVVQCSG